MFVNHKHTHSNLDMCLLQMCVQHVLNKPHHHTHWTTHLPNNHTLSSTQQVHMCNCWSAEVQFNKSLQTAVSRRVDKCCVTCCDCVCWNTHTHLNKWSRIVQKQHVIPIHVWITHNQLQYIHNIDQIILNRNNVTPVSTQTTRIQLWLLPHN